MPARNRRRPLSFLPGWRRETGAPVSLSPAGRTPCAWGRVLAVEVQRPGNTWTAFGRICVCPALAGCGWSRTSRQGRRSLHEPRGPKLAVLVYVGVNISGFDLKWLLFVPLRFALWIDGYRAFRLTLADVRLKPPLHVFR